MIYKMKIVLLFSVVILMGCETFVKVSSSESDAEILVDGTKIGQGSAKVNLKQDECHTVVVNKTGFVAETRVYCFMVKDKPKPPYDEYITLNKDESYDASVKSDRANKDFEVEVSRKLSETETWKLIREIVTGYFDDIEVTDKESGYMKTNWQVQSFNAKTIRTRIFIKQSSSSPLKYKIKLLSEISDIPNTSVKADEKFHEWDRLLRRYENVINEFQTRLGSK